MLSTRMQSAAFAPNHLPSLALWLDAADVTTITESSGLVSQWRDKSGQRNHASQDSSSHQPITAIGTIHGKNTLLFNGSSAQLNVMNNDGLYDVADGDNTIFSVAQADASFLGSGRILTFTESGGTRLDMRYETSASLVRYQSRNGFGNDVVSTQILTDVLINVGRREGFTQSVMVNRNDAITNSHGVDEDGINAVSIGARSLGDFFYGKIAEILVFSRALSECEMEEIITYLAAKWGVNLV